jgi:hypothetical protein
LPSPLASPLASPLCKDSGCCCKKQAFGISGNSVTVAKVLYDCTGDKKYLDVIKTKIEKDKDDISSVAVLSYCKPGEFDKFK